MKQFGGRSKVLFLGALAFIVIGASAQAETKTDTECQEKCRKRSEQCLARCDKKPDPAGCRSQCETRAAECAQACEMREAVKQWKQERGASQPEETAAVGTRPLKLTVRWTAEKSTTGKSVRPPASKSTAAERETLEASAVMEVPDIDYGKEPPSLYAFSYLMGQAHGPEHLTVRGGPRKKLPETKLVSFTGKTGYTSNSSITVQEIMGPTCTDTISEQGSGALQPGGADMRGSLRIALYGDRAMVEVISNEFTVTGKQTSTCANRDSSAVSKKHSISATIGDPGLFAMQGQAGPDWTVKVSRTARGYSGTARHRVETKGQGATSSEEGITVETTTLEFTLDLPER